VYSDVTNGFSPVYATTALDGLEIARSSHPAAVVTDVRLPGAMDGFELTRQLREGPRTRDIRIIILTGIRLVPNVTRRTGRAATCS
jgi:CheY-like chemotaxis protein